MNDQKKQDTDKAPELCRYSEAMAIQDASIRKGRILVVDDDKLIHKLISVILNKESYDMVSAHNADEAMQIAKKEKGIIDVVLMDLALDGANGLDILKQLLTMDDMLVGVVITGYGTMNNITEAMRAGAIDFIEKPFSVASILEVLERAMRYRRILQKNRFYQCHLEEMVAERSAELSRALEHVKQSYQATLEVLAAMLDAREDNTSRHCRRLVPMAQILAREMLLSDEEVKVIGHGALLHDFGKISMPDSVLLKHGTLNDDEWRIMKTHPRVGYEIVSMCPSLESAAEIVYSHQEHFDGTGYPRGLRGTEICIGARIFTVVDAYDAIRSNRPYSPGRSAEVAVNEIVKGRGQQFDPKVVDAFLRCHPSIEACITEQQG